jgi:hypothetical protein
MEEDEIKDDLAGDDEMGDGIMDDESIEEGETPLNDEI